MWDNRWIGEANGSSYKNIDKQQWPLNEYGQTISKGFSCTG